MNFFCVQRKEVNFASRGKRTCRVKYFTVNREYFGARENKGKSDKETKGNFFPIFLSHEKKIVEKIF